MTSDDFQHNPETVAKVSNTLHSIDVLLAKQDPNLDSAYAKAAEAEYAALVALIQNRNIPITDGMEKLAREIRDSQP